MAGWSKGPTVRIKKPKAKPTVKVNQKGQVKVSKVR